MELTFWERVERLAENHNITRKQLAAEAGFDVSNIGKGLKSNTCPSAETAVKIAKILNTSVEYLVTGEEYKQSSESAKDLDTLYKYASLSQQLETIPDHYRKSIETMICEMATYGKEFKN